jgi:protein subunit release factor A
VTIKDCEMETFTVSGAGGQHKDRKKSGVRLSHVPSGAVTESRDARDFITNRERAFLRLTQDARFLSWHRAECARRLGQKPVEEIVDEMLTPGNIKVEVRDENGRWVDA